MTSKQTVQLESLTDGTPITYGVVKPGDAPKDNGVLFIRGGDIKAGNIDRSSLRTISKEVSEQYKRTLLKGGELLVSLVGNPGEVAIVPAELAGANLARQVGLVRLDEKRVNKTYVQYYLRSPQGKGQLAANSLGSVQSVINLKELKKLEIPLPEKGIQDRIANILLTLDEKLQCNHQINQTLEQMAQAIFKSWFVDFEPVKAKIAAMEAGGSEEDALLAAMQAISGTSLFDADASAAGAQAALTRLQAEQPEQYAELRATAELFPSAMQDSELGEIPEGWEVHPILEVCDLLGGAQPPASTFSDEERPGYVRLLQIRDFTNDNHLTFVPDSKKLRKVSEDEVLIGRYGSASGNKEKDSLGRICRGKSGAYNVALMKLSPQKAGIEFCVQLFSSHDFYHYLRGTSTKAVQSGFSKKELKQYQVCLPSVGLREKYEALGQLIWSQQKRLTKQSKSLEQTRDTLLPKLLSGELSLTGAEQQLEATEPVNV